MANTSATGGPLLPTPQGPAPLEGQALLDFLQSWMVGVIGIDGKLFRPVWQPEPPNMPDEKLVWIAFRIEERPADTYPEVRHIGTGNGYDQLRRNERLALMVSAYSLGSGGGADAYLTLLRDGLAIPQNWEPLQLAGMGYVGIADMQAVPSLVKERWNYRVDLRITIQRMIVRNYGVENLLSVEGEIKTGIEDVSVEFNVES